MKSNVYFMDLRTKPEKNFSEKLNILLDRAGIASVLKKDEIAAVKLHFGEKGNTAFIRHIHIRDIADKIIKLGSRPFLTDTNTLYRGQRSDAVSHHMLALEHGFGPPMVPAPVIIADGLRSENDEKVTVNCKHFKEVLIGSAISHADALISVAHFKGHELTGFGGTLKNIGMGCASRQGKLKQHSNIAPSVERKECTGCKNCMDICPAEAIYISGKSAEIDSSKCIGCAECITICPQGAIKINWNESSEKFQEKMIEYCLGVLKQKKKRCLFINFLMNISPACDCYSHADKAIVSDIGVLASLDPVAIDRASVDLINIEPGDNNSVLKGMNNVKTDKFNAIYPEIDWKIQLNYAEKLGIGRQDYKIIKV